LTLPQTSFLVINISCIILVFISAEQFNYPCSDTCKHLLIICTEVLLLRSLNITTGPRQLFC